MVVRGLCKGGSKLQLGSAKDVKEKIGGFNYGRRGSICAQASYSFFLSFLALRFYDKVVN